jgi:ATP synthase protein I
LKVFVPPPMSEMIARAAGRARFEDDAEDQPITALTAEEARAFRAKNPQLSPWWVIVVQVVIGGVVAALAWLISGKPELMWSALYGAATAVVPGALMARCMTRRLSTLSLGASAVSFMGGSVVKMGFSVLMLMLASRLVQPLSWPALLAGMVLCMQVYWFALLWRGR